MKYTDNLNLKKPEQTEFYNVDDFNENADKLDNAINALDTRVTPIEKGGTGATTAGDACTNLGAQEKEKLYKTMTADDVSKAGWGFADESLEVKDDTTFHNANLLKVVRSGSTTDTTNAVIPWTSSNALVFGCRETKASIAMNFNTDNPAVKFMSGNTKPKWGFTIKGDTNTEYDLSNYYTKPQIETKLSGVWEIKHGGTGANNAFDACTNLGAVRTINGTGADSDCNVDVTRLKVTRDAGVLAKKASDFANGFFIVAGDTDTENTENIPFNEVGDFNLISLISECNDCLQIFQNTNKLFYRNNDSAKTEAWDSWRIIDCIVDYSIGKSGYVKYQSGLLICWGFDVCNNYATWTFPKAFALTPVVVATHRAAGKNHVISTKNVTTTKTEIVAWDVDTKAAPSTGVDACIIAIGKSA